MTLYETSGVSPCINLSAIGVIESLHASKFSNFLTVSSTEIHIVHPRKYHIFLEPQSLVYHTLLVVQLLVISY